MQFRPTVFKPRIPNVPLAEILLICTICQQPCLNNVIRPRRECSHGDFRIHVGRTIGNEYDVYNCSVSENLNDWLGIYGCSSVFFNQFSVWRFSVVFTSDKHLNGWDILDLDQISCGIQLNMNEKFEIHSYFRQSRTFFILGL